MVKNSRRNSTYKGAKAEGESKVIPLAAKTPNQQLYIDSLKNSVMTIALGPAGTGKTYIPTIMAGNLYATKDIDRIIVTRPAVSVGKTLGSLPGTLEEKYSPWLAPILTTLKEQLDAGEVETGLKNGNIVYSPLEYMRGSSFENCWVLMDEAQNLTIAEFAMFITRIGENCKVVMNGDVRQSDLKDKRDCGLTKAIHLAKKHHIDCSVVEFGVEDIVRSDLTKQWVIALYEEGLL